MMIQSTDPFTKTPGIAGKAYIDAGTRGYLKIRLPRFDKFVEIWGEE